MRAYFILPLLLLASTLHAQPPAADDNLYIPPTLTLTARDSVSVPVLNGRETHHLHVIPLLPILFFDHPGEWTIPERYQMLTGTFQAGRYADTLPIWMSKRSYSKYYELLDIVGFRLSYFPMTSITLRGGYSAEPGESPEIAAARAETVRDYLTRVWRVAPARITIAEPERMSDSSGNVFDHEEARRVLIETADWEVIRPVRYAMKSGWVDALGFRCRVVANMLPGTVASITLSAIVNDREAGSVVIPGDPATDSYEMDGSWKWIGHESTATFSTVMFDALITGTDGTQRRAQPVTIHRTTRITPVSVMKRSRVMLPFFAHRDSGLNGYHKHLLQEIADADTTSRSMSVRMEGTSEAWEMLPMDEEEAVMYHRRERASVDSITPEERFPGPYAWTGSMGLLSVRLDGRRWLSSGADPFDEYEERYLSARRVAVEPAATSRPCPDTLGIARRDAVATYLHEELGMTIIGDRGLAAPVVGERKPPLLPELRWYERGVSLVIRHEDVGSVR